MKIQLIALCMAFAACTQVAADHVTFVHNPDVKTVTTDQLVTWLATDKPPILVDARTPAYDNGQRIANATFLPYDSTDEAIAKALPDKSATIVVYCLSTTCPASGLLADRLIKAGYTNVYEYPDGLNGWKTAGHPTTKAK